MSRPEDFTVTITTSLPLKRVFVLRVVDDIKALTGTPREDLVDILDPRENETGHIPIEPRNPTDPWGNMLFPRETYGLTPEAAVEEVLNRLRTPLLRTLLASSAWRREEDNQIKPNQA